MPAFLHLHTTQESTQGEKVIVILVCISFLSLSIHPVNNSCSRHEIGNTKTHETTSIIKQNKYTYCSILSNA